MIKPFADSEPQKTNVPLPHLTADAYRVPCVAKDFWDMSAVEECKQIGRCSETPDPIEGDKDNTCRAGADTTGKCLANDKCELAAPKLFAAALFAYKFANQYHYEPGHSWGTARHKCLHVMEILETEIDATTLKAITDKHQKDWEDYKAAKAARDPEYAALDKKFKDGVEM